VNSSLPEVPRRPLDFFMKTKSILPSPARSRCQFARRSLKTPSNTCGAVAVELASRLHHGTDYGALVLESTFSRMSDVAAAAGFWGRIGAAMTTLEFDALSKIGDVDSPILMLHGTEDKTVPIEVGRRLRDAAPAGVRWIEVPGGSHSTLHSDAPVLYRRSFAELMNALASPITAAPRAVKP